MRTRIHTLTAYTLLVGFIIIMHVAGWLRPLESFLRDVIQPGAAIMHSWGVTHAEQSEFQSAQDLLDAYHALKEQQQIARIDATQLVLLQSENEELKRQLAYVSSTTSTFVGAAVVGKSIDPLSRTIILSAGAGHGIEQGDPVIAGEGILIGQVISVDERRTIVRLIDDNGSRIAATILNKQRSIGLVEGGFGISVHMTFIPQNEIIPIGETVVTSGLDDRIPRGLLIGRVESVEKQPYQPFQKAIISPLLPLDKLLNVSVLTRS